MAYADEQTIAEAHGNEFLDLIADKDDDGNRDAAAIAAALSEAGSVIDGYIGQRYPLPLSQVPAVLKTLCVDIAVYRLAGSSQDTVSEDIRSRYRDAIAFLRDVSAGKASLGLPETAAEGGSGSIELTSKPRRFSRDSLRGM